jgi:hypothetical protein
VNGSAEPTLTYRSQETIRYRGAAAVRRGDRKAERAREERRAFPTQSENAPRAPYRLPEPINPPPVHTGGTEQPSTKLVSRVTGPDRLGEGRFLSSNPVVER